MQEPEVNISFNKDEYIELLFDLHKSIEQHKKKAKEYEAIKLQQGVDYENARINALSKIREKIKKGLENERN